jgi:DNA helicase II / ATP-dependent DNA helicase PcrA
MKLTDSQSDAVKHDNNTIVVACPGSGKTRCLVAKLLHSINEVRGSSRKIACITYTNAAVHEIETRLRTYGSNGDEDYCEISTIHAFCLNNILRFFHWRLDRYKDAFKVIPPDCEIYQEIVQEVCSKFSLASKAKEAFELLNREPDGRPICSHPLAYASALEFWKLLENKEYIDFPNIVYFSLTLLKSYPSISSALSSKYAWILVDEFQDTSALQVEILKCIAAEGKSKFFLVGDPYQSIYGFAGARPDLMDEFARDIKAKSDFPLLGNFRSSSSIISHAEKLFPRKPPMYASGLNKNIKEKPVYVHTSNAFNAITDYFLPALNDLGIGYGESAILAPWWIKLLHIGRSLREYGIPIVGPGARPYKRSHFFARLAEQVCYYITEPDNNIIPRIEKELFLMIANLEGKANYSVFSYQGRKIVFKLIRIGKKLLYENEAGIDWLNAAAREFVTILVSADFISASSSVQIVESIQNMEADMIKNRVDVANLSVHDLGLFANTDKNMKLLTMHRAKGREFQAVALLDVHEGKIPHYSAASLREINESKRLLYVSITRAKRYLLYVTDSENYRNEPSRFLLKGELGLQQILL